MIHDTELFSDEVSRLLETIKGQSDRRAARCGTGDLTGVDRVDEEAESEPGTLVASLQRDGCEHQLLLRSFPGDLRLEVQTVPQTVTHTMQAHIAGRSIEWVWNG